MSRQVFHDSESNIPSTNFHVMSTSISLNITYFSLDIMSSQTLHSNSYNIIGCPNYYTTCRRIEVCTTSFHNYATRIKSTFMPTTLYDIMLSQSITLFHSTFRWTNFLSIRHDVSDDPSSSQLAYDMSSSQQSHDMSAMTQQIIHAICDTTSNYLIHCCFKNCNSGASSTN